MPLLHCNECHHEWEATSKGEKCDWCGADSYVLEEKTALEKALPWIRKYRIKRKTNKIVES